jgi:hypothetical protein
MLIQGSKHQKISSANILPTQVMKEKELNDGRNNTVLVFPQKNIAVHYIPQFQT